MMDDEYKELIMSDVRENILLEKSHAFAVEIIKLYKLFAKNR
jgi:hypothetical protein